MTLGVYVDKSQRYHHVSHLPLTTVLDFRPGMLYLIHNTSAYCESLNLGDPRRASWKRTTQGAPSPGFYESWEPERVYQLLIE